MQCYNCNKISSDFLGFCPFCGVEKKEFNVCPNCGKKVLKEVNLCPDCGFKPIEESHEMKSDRLNKECLNLSHYRDKLVFLNESLRFNEKNLDAWKNKASILNRFYGNEKTIKCCDDALKISADNKEFLLLKARAMKKSDKEKEDIFNYLLKKCNDDLKIDPSDEESWIVKGEVFGALNRTQDEIECYSKALEINPLNKELWIKLALSHGYIGEYENYINCYHKALELSPSDWTLYKEIAKTYQIDLEDNERAVEYFTKALELNPNDRWLWHDKASLLDEMGIYDESVKCYDKFIMLCPDNIMALRSKAEILKKMNRLEEAIECCNQALDISNRSLVRGLKSDLLIKLKRYDDALENYDEAIKIDPDYDGMYISKGELLHDLGRYEEEIKNYDAYLNKDDQNFHYYDIAEKLKGRALLKMDKEKGTLYLNELLERIDHLLEIFPKDGEEWVRKSDVSYYLNKLEDSIECLQNALRDENIDRLEIWSRIGQIYYELKKYDEAIVYLDKVLNYSPDHIFALEYKGYCLEDLKEFDEAVEIYDKILHSDASQEEIRSRREKLIKYYKPKNE